MVTLKSSLRKFVIAIMTWLCVTECLYHRRSRTCSVCCSQFAYLAYNLSRDFSAGVTWRVPLVQQEMLTLSINWIPMAHYFQLQVFTFSLPCCNVCYEFLVAMFGSFLLLFNLWRGFMIFSAICIYWRTQVSNTISWWHVFFTVTEVK